MQHTRRNVETYISFYFLPDQCPLFNGWLFTNLKFLLNLISGCDVLFFCNCRLLLEPTQFHALILFFWFFIFFTRVPLLLSNGKTIIAMQQLYTSSLLIKTVIKCVANFINTRNGRAPRRMSVRNFKLCIRRVTCENRCRILAREWASQAADRESRAAEQCGHEEKRLGQPARKKGLSAWR